MICTLVGVASLRRLWLGPAARPAVTCRHHRTWTCCPTCPVTPATTTPAPPSDLPPTSLTMTTPISLRQICWRWGREVLAAVCVCDDKALNASTGKFQTFCGQWCGRHFATPCGNTGLQPWNGDCCNTAVLWT